MNFLINVWKSLDFEFLLGKVDFGHLDYFCSKKEGA